MYIVINVQAHIQNQKHLPGKSCTTASATFPLTDDSAHWISLSEALGTTS